MGKRKSEQAPLWIPTTELPVSPGFPESSLRENRQADWSGLTVMVGLLELGRRNVADAPAAPSG